uniref:Saposin type B domain containing protein n=1 Tax=Haemonchus contortus TaxID=6289 RepID=A0A7I4XT87_HAECO
YFRNSFPCILKEVAISSAMAVFSMFPLATLLMLIGSAISEPKDPGVCQKCEMVANMVRDHFKDRLKDVTPSQTYEKLISVCEENLGEAHLKMCQKVAKEELKLIHSHLQADEKVHVTCKHLKLC